MRRAVLFGNAFDMEHDLMRLRNGPFLRCRSESAQPSQSSYRHAQNLTAATGPIIPPNDRPRVLSEHKRHARCVGEHLLNVSFETVLRTVSDDAFDCRGR